uniref:Bulb-type lectin domain-containing protein n=1 Tax=Solanum lycopersicum TaxID=4081 RepID=A0A3Q7HAW0_SOLLC
MSQVLSCNRDNPLNLTSSGLNFTRQEILTLLNGSGRVTWSSDSTRHRQNLLAQLLDSGIIVVRDADEDQPQNYLWQSFDNLGYTVLPGMKEMYPPRCHRNFQSLLPKHESSNNRKAIVHNQQHKV